MAVTTPRQYSVSVGTSVVEVFPQPSKEIGVLTFRNTSTGAQVISLGIGTEAVAGSGIVMQPGDVVTWSKDLAIAVPQERFTALSTVAAGSLAVYYQLVD